MTAFQDGFVWGFAATVALYMTTRAMRAFLLYLDTGKLWQ